MKHRLVWTTASLAVLISAGPIAKCVAQESFSRGPMPVSEAKQAAPEEICGRLEQRDGQFVLVDERDRVLVRLSAQDATELSGLVGQQVRANVRQPFLRISGEPKYWVEKIESLDAAREPGLLPVAAVAERPGTVMLAQHTEPVVMGTARTNAITLSDVAVPTHGGPPGRLWGSAEYLGWWASGMAIPPLVTTSPLGTAREEAGVLGESGTSIVFGDGEILDGFRNGLRLRSGFWIDRDHRFGVQGEYLSLEQESELFTATGDATGNPILARPFFNINPRNPLTDAFDPPAREDAELVSYPDVLEGNIMVDANTRLESAGLALRTLLAGRSYCSEKGTGYSRVDLLAGYRYMRLSDYLYIGEQANSLQAEFPVAFEVFDQFNTQNRFQGADVGMAWQAGWRRWSGEVLLKTAFGNVHQDVRINGGTSISQAGGAPVDYTGGLLALPSNIGTYSNDRFGVIPEVGVNFQFAIFPRLRATVGYTLIYWGNVVRAGHQIDRDVNPDQLPPPLVPAAGALRPEFDFQEHDYWAQGFSAGIEGRW